MQRQLVRLTNTLPTTAPEPCVFTPLSSTWLQPPSTHTCL
ncbi:hypothetical protein STRIP9103_02705 [Streptomyces ipomoeae 91-03]|uniref:Uncharacterized protein n=1 Tax=Streptomyces ipomoeae 91-03 TaxID=698759 RepID=L1KL48_9ACTN|nr:hypothetical protein STRIP9103_02705 [Streptomyces ipomoeae 91-03]